MKSLGYSGRPYSITHQVSGFLSYSRKKLLFVELGVGRMTPMFIQEPFWALVNSLPRAKYITVNAEYAFLPAAIEDKGMAIRQDIGKTLADCRRKITALH